MATASAVYDGRLHFAHLLGQLTNVLKKLGDVVTTSTRNYKSSRPHQDKKSSGAHATLTANPASYYKTMASALEESLALFHLYLSVCQASVMNWSQFGVWKPSLVEANALAWSGQAMPRPKTSRMFKFTRPSR